MPTIRDFAGLTTLVVAQGEVGGIVQQYFNSQRHEGIAYFSCINQTKGVATDGSWTGGSWYVYCPDASHGYVVDHFFIDWLQRYKRWETPLNYAIWGLCVLLGWSALSVWHLDFLLVFAIFIGGTLLALGCFGYLFGLPIARRLRSRKRLPIPAILGEAIGQVEAGKARRGLMVLAAGKLAGGAGGMAAGAVLGKVAERAADAAADAVVSSIGERTIEGYEQEKIAELNREAQRGRPPGTGAG